MQYVIVGILDSYGDAEAAVEDLELAGIVGHQVEVITNIDEDARTATPRARRPRSPTSHIATGLGVCSVPAALSKKAKRATFPANSQTTSANKNFTPITSNRAAL